ncbi:hypothetical protein PAPYR_6387 [Paratrimastix pyriformis]|uniref:Uncharacterized protein n=1 Tax=Paratrimastix pyriformis TaxID=342808 RepID=A0ABQ8UFD3_9EUKA|nr:hypothetical protein PAPYR_6387 [Paratrimastix pyriformis]
MLADSCSFFWSPYSPHHLVRSAFEGFLRRVQPLRVLSELTWALGDPRQGAQEAAIPFSWNDRIVGAVSTPLVRKTIVPPVSLFVALMGFPQDLIGFIAKNAPTDVAVEINLISRALRDPDLTEAQLVAEFAGAGIVELLHFPDYLRQEVAAQLPEPDLEVLLATMRKQMPTATLDMLLERIRSAPCLDSLLMDLYLRFGLPPHTNVAFLFRLPEIRRGGCRMQVLDSGPAFDAFVAGLGEHLRESDGQALVDNARIFLTPDDFIRNALFLRGKINDHHHHHRHCQLG